MMVRERVMSIVLRERDALVDPKQSFLALSRLSHFFKNRTTTQSFSDPHVMRAREREETSPRERERVERERDRSSSSSFAVVARVQNSDADGKRTTPMLSKEKRKDPHERESDSRTRDIFIRDTKTRTGYLQHRLKRRRVGLLFHQTRERVRGQTRCVTSGGRCCCHLTLVRRKALRELCDDANAMRRKKAKEKKRRVSEFRVSF